MIRERFVGLARLESPAFLRFNFYVEKQHREQHRTKNSPKTATNCAQITQDTKTTPCRGKWSSFPISYFTSSTGQWEWSSHVLNQSRVLFWKYTIPQTALKNAINNTSVVLNAGFPKLRSFPVVFQSERRNRRLSSAFGKLFLCIFRNLDLFSFEI